MSEERKKQIKKRVLLKIRCIRAFDNRQNKTIKKNAKYQNTLTEERKRQIVKRVMLKLKCIRALDNRKKRVRRYIPIKDAKYVNTLSEERKI